MASSSTTARTRAYDAASTIDPGSRVAPFPELRIIAQDIVTKRRLDLDLPITDLSLVETLSGTQEITGDFSPVLPEIEHLGFTPWGTRFYADDADGELKGSTLMTPPFLVDEGDGEKRNVSGVGFHGYLAKETFEGDFTGSSTGEDPLALVRMLVAHVQAKVGRSYLGVTVSPATSNVRVGGQPPADNSGLVGPRVQQDTTSGTTDVKPYALGWWDNENVGKEIEDLAGQCPFDFAERQRWLDRDTLTAEHYLDLGYPRLGIARRGSFAFVQGENVLAVTPGGLADVDAGYVDGVRILGAGEGRAKVTGAAWRTQPARLPIWKTIVDPAVRSTSRAVARASAELWRLSVTNWVSKILLDARHVYAPWGSFHAGDDIYVECEIDWIGVIQMWHRVLKITYTPAEEKMAVDLAPSSIFRYGAAD